MRVLVESLKRLFQKEKVNLETIMIMKNAGKITKEESEYITKK